MKFLLVFFSILLFNMNAIAQVDSRLVAHLPFEGWLPKNAGSSSVDTTSDITGHGHYGNVNGALKIPDRFGRVNCAYEFNGNSSIVVNNPDSLFLNNYTVTYWVKPYQVTPQGQYHYTISMGGFGGDNSMSINNNGYYGFVAGAYNLSAPISIASNGIQIVPNRWYFIAFSRSNNKLSLYINGQLAAQDDIDNGSLPNYGNGARNVTMGVRCSFNSDSYLTGALDDVRFYNSVLADDEIASFYIFNSVDDELNENLKVYPNPSLGTLYFNNVPSLSQCFNYNIINLQGSIVQTGQLDGNKISIDPQISNGTYILELHNIDGVSTYKKIVLNK